MTDLLKTLRDCLKDDDRDAAVFLRDGVFETIKLHGSWLTEQEKSLLSSF
jgi:hypothetical protein